MANLIKLLKFDSSYLNPIDPTRHVDTDLHSLNSLRLLVAPSLHLGRYSPGKAIGFLKPVDPLPRSWCLYKGLVSFARPIRSPAQIASSSYLHGEVLSLCLY